MTRKQPLTTRLCETKPAKRVKVYDDKCPGLFVSITPRGIATFYVRYWERALNKQVTLRLGDYDPEHLTVEDARAQAFDVKARVGKGEDVAQTARKAKAQKAKLSGKTVAEVIKEYIDWAKEPVKKADGEKRPRIERWEAYAGLFRRFALPTIGKMVASEVENDDIARLLNDIQHGRVNRKYKGSLSNARNTRYALSSMFTWAAEAGRRYVKLNPCRNLPRLDPPSQRERVLNDDEIRTLWHGLDRPDFPFPRSIALAIKFELVTMLRTKEFLTGTPDELKGLGTQDAQFHIPARRVKARRVIVQPLSPLAQEILAEAIADKEQPFIFSGYKKGKPHQRNALCHAAKGLVKRGRVFRKGICEWLGMIPWTPHDLRRTAASLAYDIGFSEADVGMCLDHTKYKGQDAPARVTGVYVRGGVVRKSRELDEKRKILDTVGLAFQRIIRNEPPVFLHEKVAA